MKIIPTQFEEEDDDDDELVSAVLQPARENTTNINYYFECKMKLAQLSLLDAHISNFAPKKESKRFARLIINDYQTCFEEDPQPFDMNLNWIKR